MTELIQALNAHAPNILRTLGLMEIQIAILALLVLAIEHALRQPLPKIRYALWVVVLVKCLLPPFLPMPASALATITNFESLPIFVGAVPVASTAPANVSLATVILLLWFAVSLVMIALAWRRFQALQSQLHKKAAVILSEIAPAAAKQFSWPPIWQVEHLPTPAAIGLFQPQIYLTAKTIKSDGAARRAVLYHELAHVRRRDSWIVLLQTLAQIIHPFNPFVWLMNLRLFRYREEICDDFALQHAAVSPREYGEILLRFLETRAASPITVRAGTCFFETAQGLKQRLNYLLMPKEATMNRFNWKHKLLVAGLLGMLPMVSWQCNNRPDSPVAPAAAEGKIISPSNFVQFDQPPQVFKRAAAKYPQLALKAGMSGIVWVKLKINENGKVEAAQVEKSAPANLGFEAAALTAARQFEFTPARLKQQPVAAWITIPFHFKIAADQAAAPSRYFQFNLFNPAAVIVLPDDNC